ncbi:MAG: acyl-ACP thioesterase domain-containing protein [Bdellovibrionota bacterium]
MNPTVWTEQYKVTSFLVNLRGQAGLYAILNFIQDVGWQHAIQTQIKLPKNQGWVFTRQKLVMSEWPAWNKTVMVKTWLRPPVSETLLMRDYELFLEDRKIGEATSTISVIDLKERKLAAVDWSSFPKIWATEHVLSLKPAKIIISAETSEAAQFQVRNSDIDLNQHVNNTKYAQWVLDSLPINILKAGATLKEYEVNFLAETKIGDVVVIQQTKDQVDGDTSVIQFQGIRSGDGKAVFTAQMRVSYDA